MYPFISATKRYASQHLNINIDFKRQDNKDTVAHCFIYTIVRFMKLILDVYVEILFKNIKNEHLQLSDKRQREQNSW